MQTADEIKEELLSTLLTHEEEILEFVKSYNLIGEEIREYDPTMCFSTLRGVEICYFTYKRKILEIIDFPPETLQKNTAEDLNYCSFLEAHRVMCYMLKKVFSGLKINEISYYDSFIKIEILLKNYINKSVMEFKRQNKYNNKRGNLRLIKMNKAV